MRGFRRTLFETDGGAGRTFHEARRTIGAMDAHC